MFDVFLEYSWAEEIWLLPFTHQHPHPKKKRRKEDYIALWEHSTIRRVDIHIGQGREK